MDDSGDDEDGEHRSCSAFPFRQLRGSEGEQREGSGVRPVHRGICVTGITGSVKLLNPLHHVARRFRNSRHNPPGHCVVVFFNVIYLTVYVIFSVLRWHSAHPEEVSVSVVIEPVMNHHIPGTVIVGERRGVPPVLENQHRGVK